MNLGADFLGVCGVVEVEKRCLCGTSVPSGAPFASPCPGLYGTGVGPQASVSCASIGLQAAQVCVCPRYVSIKDPGHTVGHHVGTGIAPLARHIGNHAAVAILGAWRDARLLFKAQGGQVLPTHFTEWLAALWRVNGGNPHGHLLVGAWLAAAGFDGVAIGDADDKAGKNRRKHGLDAELLQDGRQKLCQKNCANHPHDDAVLCFCDVGFGGVVGLDYGHIFLNSGKPIASLLSEGFELGDAGFHVAIIWGFTARLQLLAAVRPLVNLQSATSVLLAVWQGKLANRGKAVLPQLFFV